MYMLISVKKYLLFQLLKGKKQKKKNLQEQMQLIQLKV